MDHDDDPTITLRASELLDVLDALKVIRDLLPDAPPREHVDGLATYLLLRIGPALGRVMPTLKA